MPGKCYYNLYEKQSGGRNKNSAYAKSLDFFLPVRATLILTVLCKLENAQLPPTSL